MVKQRQLIACVSYLFLGVNLFAQSDLERNEIQKVFNCTSKNKRNRATLIQAEIKSKDDLKLRYTAEIRVAGKGQEGYYFIAENSNVPAHTYSDLHNGGRYERIYFRMKPRKGYENKLSKKLVSPFDVLIIPYKRGDTIRDSERLFVTFGPHAFTCMEI